MNAQAATTGGMRSSRTARLSTLAIMAVTAVIIVVVAYAVNQPASTAAGLTSVSLSADATGNAPEIGKPAPDFAATTADGRTVKLSDFRGTPVWLTFGASWCQPCRAENADIMATAKAYDGKIKVVQVFLSEDAAAVRDYATRVGIPYTTIPDPSTAISAQYRILGIPSHFFIDANGVLQAMKVGSLDPTTMAASVTQVTK